MSLGKKLVQSAQKEAAMKTPFPQTANAAIARAKGSEVQATAKIADSDRYSKMATEVRVKVQGAKSSATATQKAQRFAQRATYFSEALRHVETDLGGTAIVRSTPETMAGRGAPYFEAAVRDDEITLRRYSGAKGKREQIPFCVTDDVLSRAVDDAASVLAPEKK